MAIDDVYNAVLGLEQNDIKDLVETELERGADADFVLNQGLIKAMDEVGRRYSQGIMFVPEMLMAAKITKAALEVLRPYWLSGGGKSKGTVVICTVKNDLHDIGKNIVAISIEGAGYDVVDLGTDVDEQRLLDAAKAHDADIVALSALLTTTMLSMRATVARIRRQAPGLRVIVGGAPLNAPFAERIGADGFGPNPAVAVELVRRLMPVQSASSPTRRRAGVGTQSGH